MTAYANALLRYLDSTKNPTTDGWNYHALEASIINYLKDTGYITDSLVVTDRGKAALRQGDSILIPDARYVAFTNPYLLHYYGPGLSLLSLMKTNSIHTQKVLRGNSVPTSDPNFNRMYYSGLIDTSGYVTKSGEQLVASLYDLYIEDCKATVVHFAKMKNHISPTVLDTFIDPIPNVSSHLGTMHLRDEVMAPLIEELFGDPDPIITGLEPYMGYDNGKVISDIATIIYGSTLSKDIIERYENALVMMRLERTL